MTTTYPEVDLECAVASLACMNATKAQQSRAYRYIEELLSALIAVDGAYRCGADLNIVLDQVRAVIAQSGAEQ